MKAYVTKTVELLEEEKQIVESLEKAHWKGLGTQEQANLLNDSLKKLDSNQAKFFAISVKATSNDLKMEYILNNPDFYIFLRKINKKKDGASILFFSDFVEQYRDDVFGLKYPQSLYPLLFVWAKHGGAVYQMDFIQNFLGSNLTTVKDMLSNVDLTTIDPILLLV
ncbi:MAG: hypothetical protein BGO07_00475 [Alphaproteobacteria bacterium 40-19]|nr:MAG: hypothetical protein BGO07_00475 [Alphaproteobacteria bacterium 40-19]